MARPLTESQKRGFLFDPDRYVDDTSLSFKLRQRRLGKSREPTLNLLHRTHDPNFKIDPDFMGPNEVIPGTRFFGARTAEAMDKWATGESLDDEIRSRGFIARVSVPDAFEGYDHTVRDFISQSAPIYGDYMKGLFNDEVVLTEQGVNKAKIEGVNPARIFRSHLNPKADLGERGPGPTGIVRSPRQPHLPGMEGTRASTGRITELQRARITANVEESRATRSASKIGLSFGDDVSSHLSNESRLEYIAQQAARTTHHLEGLTQQATDWTTSVYGDLTGHCRRATGHLKTLASQQGLELGTVHGLFDKNNTGDMSGTHFWNVTPDGTILDPTGSQFPGGITGVIGRNHPNYGLYESDEALAVARAEETKPGSFITLHFDEASVRKRGLNFGGDAGESVPHISSSTLEIKPLKSSVQTIEKEESFLRAVFASTPAKIEGGVAAVAAVGGAGAYAVHHHRRTSSARRAAAERDSRPGYIDDPRRLDPYNFK